MADRGKSSSDVPKPVFQFSAGAGSSSVTTGRRRRSSIPNPVFQLNAAAPFASGAAPFASSAAPFASGAAPFASSAAPFASGAAPFASGAVPFASGAAPFASSAAPFASGAAPFASSAAEQMARDDAWKVCNPDFKTPFTDLEDACNRLLPYHVVADFEDEYEDEKFTGWDNNLSAKIAEFNARFEDQVKAFNALKSYRTEEEMMIEKLLLQDERQAMLKLRSEINTRNIMAAVQQSHEEYHVPAAPAVRRPVSSAELNAVAAAAADEDMIQLTDDFLYEENETDSE